MKVVKRKKKNLYFYDTETIDYKTRLPFIIDAENNVLLGNSMRNNYEKDEDIECIVIKSDNYIADALYFLEDSVAAEKSVERYQQIEFALRRYIADEKDKSENLSFFDLKVLDTITPKNYITPPPYNFEKGRKKIVEDNDPTLFNFHEEEVVI